MKMSEVYKFTRRVFIPIVIPLAVCACSVKVAIDANEIAKMQAIITLNSTAPEIDVCEYCTKEDGKSINFIDITVLSGRAANFKTEAIAFIDVLPDRYTQTDFVYDIIQIPSFGYYSELHYNGEIYGHNDCWSGGEYYNRVLHLQNLLNDYYADYKMHFYTELHSYVKVDYINVMGENETLYYSIDDNRLDSDSWADMRAYVMDKNEGEAKFEEYYKLMDDGIDLALYDDEALLSNFFSMVAKSNSQVASDFGLESYIE